MYLCINTHSLYTYEEGRNINDLNGNKVYIWISPNLVHLKAAYSNLYLAFCYFILL